MPNLYMFSGILKNHRGLFLIYFYSRFIMSYSTLIMSRTDSIIFNKVFQFPETFNRRPILKVFQKTFLLIWQEKTWGPKWMICPRALRRGTRNKNQEICWPSSEPLISTRQPLGLQWAPLALRNWSVSSASHFNVLAFEYVIYLEIVAKIEID